MHNVFIGKNNYQKMTSFILFKAESEGKIKVSGMKVNAKINIANVRNFSATISVRGESNLPFGYLQAIQQHEKVEMKSLTFVYVRKASPTPKPNAQNAIGNRRDGDKLLHFESRNVTNFNRFPSRAFQYTGKEYLTYVGFSFNVSAATLTNGFSYHLLRRILIFIIYFQSPTAMAMVNTSFVGEQEFNAIVYDMNTEHFMANMSVYGIVSKKKPDHFLGICSP